MLEDTELHARYSGIFMFLTAPLKCGLGTGMTAIEVSEFNVTTLTLVRAVSKICYKFLL